MRYFEDVEVGDAAEFGGYQVTAEEVVAFAERYDPQPFHTDEAAAQGSVFGGLVASGWHTAAMCMRMRVDAEGKEVPLLGSRGVDELRWRRPVRPGDTLRVRTEVVG
ncbi:MAG TPA: MaoC/PaaZ C-terminal domain-containing protein, partial [Halobacteriales archaeon]|nr:MaoC/PaaZ C-terminal domain-containing protein [Halobacteriales archaeon]